MAFLGVDVMGGRALPMLAAATVTAALTLTPAPHPGVPATLAGPAVTLTAADLGALDPAAFDPTALPLGAESFGAESIDIAALAAATGWGAGVENLYNTLEPWAAYGANLLAWLVHWVPWVGLLAPQINIFYDLGEQIVRTLLFSTVEVLDGSAPFLGWFGAVGSGISEAFGDFFQNQYSWIRGFFPPLPPGFPALPSALPAAESAGADLFGHLDLSQWELPHLDLPGLDLPQLDLPDLDPGDVLAAALPDLGF